MDKLLVQHRDLVQGALPLWGLDARTKISLLNYSENTTFELTTPEGKRYILRLYRFGHHSKDAIASELAWMAALYDDKALSTASVITGRDGAAIQQCASHELPKHFLVMFTQLNGTEPVISENLTAPFRQLGTLAARAHLHAQQWHRPEWFTRPTWDETAVFYADPLWGHWRDGPNVHADYYPALTQAEQLIQQHLQQYGKASHRFGLIHADMRLANLLIDQQTTHVIDFDDCGFGWWMYDFAAAVSFFEDHPQIPALQQAWLQGYQTIRTLDTEDVAIIDTLVMLRRMHLLGWLGTHASTDIARELASHFAARTHGLALAWIDNINTAL